MKTAERLKILAAAQRKWAAANPEKVRATQRKKYVARREELIERAWIYALNNPDKVRAYKRKHAATPEGKAAKSNAAHERRARKNACESRATKSQIKTIISEAIRCHYCKVLFDTFRKPTIDHVIPISKGGPHCVSNLVVACLPCNLEKGSKLTFKGCFH